MLFCGDLWWIIGVRGINRLIGGFSFGCFLIVTFKCINFCDRRKKKFKVLKCFVNIFVRFLRRVWFKISL